MELRHGKPNGCVYFGFSPGTGDVKFAGFDKQDAVDFIQRHGDWRVFQMMSTLTNTHEVELVPPIPATVQIKGIEAAGEVQ